MGIRCMRTVLLVCVPAGLAAAREVWELACESRTDTRAVCMVPHKETGRQTV